MRDLLPDELLASGNGLLSTIDQGLRLLSPLVGAGAYALFGGFAIAVVTSVMLLGAALVMLTVRVVETPPDEHREPFWPEVTAGARHIRHVPVLARMTVVMGVAFGVTGLANTAVFAVVDQGLHRGSEFFGVLAAIQGGGSVVGGIVAASLIARTGERGAVRGRAGVARRGDGGRRRPQRARGVRVDGARRRQRAVDRGGVHHPAPAAHAGSPARSRARPPPTWR